MKIEHINIDITVKKMKIVQKGDCFFVVSAFKKGHYLKGGETDNEDWMASVLHTCLMTPDVDKIIIESSTGKVNLTFTMRRIKDNSWDYEVEDDREDERDD